MINKKLGLIIVLVIINGCDRVDIASEKETKINDHGIVPATKIINQKNSINNNLLESKIISNNGSKEKIDKPLSNEETIALLVKNEIADLKNKMGEEAYNKSAIGKMNNLDPKVSIDISDERPEFQKILRQQLKDEKEKGYIEIEKKLWIMNIM